MRRQKFAALMLALGTVVLGACSGTRYDRMAAAGGVAADTVASPATLMDRAPQADADTLYSLVEAQVAFGPRNPGSKGHAACYQWLLRRLRQAGVDTLRFADLPVKTYMGKEITARNILAQINPGADKRILYVAHWDTRPVADNDDRLSNRNIPVPGANDGGSGTAVLLEIARLAAADTLLRPLGIDLLFVDAEDSGETENWGSSEETWCLGTQEWVKHMPYTQKNRPQFGVLFDMVGGLDARFHREHTSHQMAPAVVDKVWGVAHASGFKERFPNTLGASIVDDHLFLNRAGIPTVNIIENVNPETGSFNPTWHTLADDMGGIDRQTLRAVAQVGLNVLYNELPASK